MERLTIKTEKGAALKMGDTYPSEDVARKDLVERYRIAIDRLAAYEDTGLTPVEIRELKDLWKVVCKLYGINTVGLSINNPLTLEELREMDGKPVWVVGVSSIGHFNGHWDICDWENGDVVFFPYCMEIPGLHTVTDRRRK